MCENVWTEVCEGLFRYMTIVNMIFVEGHMEDYMCSFNNIMCLPSENQVAYYLYY